MSEPFENLLERRGNGSMKWEKAYIQKRFGIWEDEHIYPLFIADMDYKMDERIHTHLLHAMNQPDFGYFHIQNGFYDSIMEWQKQIHHLELKKEWILPSIGTITSLNIACDLYARNENILMFTPVYGAFQKCAGVGSCVTLPLVLHDMRYDIDFDALEVLLKTKDIKALMFCNPHNPSGRVWKKEELQRLVMLCKQHQVYLFSDEIHSDIMISEEPFVSLFSFADEYDRILVSTSANKTFNLSGLCTSYLLCKNQTMREEIQAYLDRLHLSCNRIGVMMSEYAYSYGREWYEALLIELKSNIQLVKHSIKDTNIKIMEPESGYLVWMYLPNVSDIDEFVLALAKETHVLVESGSRFVDSYDGWIRINTATSTALLKAAMDVFVNFYNHYNGQKEN